MAAKILRSTKNLQKVYNTDAVDAMQVANKEYSDSIIGCYAVPDYANMETVNRISTNGGTWTADRNGFVKARVTISTGNNQNLALEVRINDKLIYRQLQSSNAAGWTFDINECFAVKKGDVIKLTAVGSVVANCVFYCYFIPAAPIANFNCYPDRSNPDPAHGGTKTVNMAAAGTKAHIFTAQKDGNYTVWVNQITPNVSMVYCVNDSTVTDNDFYIATLPTGNYATLNINLREGDSIYVKNGGAYTSSAKFTWHYRPLVPVTE